MPALNISPKSDGMCKKNLGTLEEQRTHVPGAQCARGLVIQEVTCFQIGSQ